MPDCNELSLLFSGNFRISMHFTDPELPHQTAPIHGNIKCSITQAIQEVGKSAASYISFVKITPLAP